MRKRKVLPLLLALALTLSLIPASAAYELPEAYHIYQCYEGFASLQDFTGEQLNGYVNQAGEVVIPCIYGRYYSAGDTLVGHFHNGRVWVLKKDYSMDFQTWQPAEDTWEVAQLDEQGNMVVPWKEVPAHAPGLHMVNDGGVCDDCGEGNLIASEVRTPEPEKPEEPEKPLSLYVYSSDETEGQPYGSCELTNNTEERITGTYALLSYWPDTSYYPPSYMYPEEHEYFYAFLFPFDVDLAPHESAKFNFENTVVGWSTMSHYWIEFEDRAELEALMDNDAVKFARDSYVFDYYEKGIQAFKDIFGLPVYSGKDGRRL